jgi:hypothetical protein
LDLRQAVLAIVALLAIVAASYIQTIHAYPNGGGAYIVARDNLGKAPAAAGAALLVGYVLTVAVSISSGVAQLNASFPALYLYRVYLAVVLTVLVMLINLRGGPELGLIFAIPTYFFVVMMFVALIAGMVQHCTGTLAVVEDPPPVEIVGVPQALTLFLLLRAFTSGTPTRSELSGPANINGQAMTQAAKDQGHRLARNCRAPGDRWVRHPVDGEWIVLATTPIRIARMGGKMPPPARSMAIEIRIMTRAPCFRWTNRVAHTSRARESRTARIPVTSRLGMTVIAGSPATLRKNAELGQDRIMTPARSYAALQHFTDPVLDAGQRHDGAECRSKRSCCVVHLETSS